MNQILSVEKINKKPKKEKKKRERRTVITGKVREILKILRVFAISLIVYGVLNIGTGAFAIYRTNNYLDNRPVIPDISLEQSDDKNVTIVVESELAISEMYYKWGNDETVRINGNSRTLIEEETRIPSGQNLLSVTAINEAGNTQVLQYTFTRNSNIDIKITSAEPRVKIEVEGKNEIAYMTYRWNNEQETKIDVEDYTKEQEIRVRPGKNTLTVTAVDVNNETEVIKQKIEGVESEGPTVDVIPDEDGKLIINAVDPVGLSRVEVIVNNQEGKYKSLEGITDFKEEIPIELTEGENQLQVIVYNADGLTDEYNETINVDRNSQQ